MIMNLENFITKFAEIFNDMDTATISPETRFRNLDQWSSLSALGVIALAEDEFDVELSGADLRNADTIQDLYNLILSKV